MGAPCRFRVRRHRRCRGAKKKADVLAGLDPNTNVSEGHLGGYIRSGKGREHGDPWTWYPQLWEWVCKELGVASVIDVGCGEGHAAGFFRDMGCRVLGIDGSREARIASIIPDAHVLHDYQDGPVDPARVGPEPWDMVWSCEFVEHVDERYVGNFLATFSLARKVLLMTYAGPGQPGWNHVNCRDESYWIEKVESTGLRFDEMLTRAARNLAHEHFAERGLVFVRR